MKPNLFWALVFSGLSWRLPANLTCPLDCKILIHHAPPLNGYISSNQVNIRGNRRRTGFSGSYATQKWHYQDVLGFAAKRLSASAQVSRGFPGHTDSPDRRRSDVATACISKCCHGHAPLAHSLSSYPTARSLPESRCFPLWARAANNWSRRSARIKVEGRDANFEHGPVRCAQYGPTQVHRCRLSRNRSEAI